MTGDRSVPVRVSDLSVADKVGRAILDAVSLSVVPGRRLAIAGESGAGKTTLALALVGHLRPGLRHVGGVVDVGGCEVFRASAGQLRSLRRNVASYLGQDPAASLTPNMRVGAQIAEISGDASVEAVAVRLEALGLPGTREFQRRYPHEVSGGQRQRVALARALAADPALLVLDEPTSSLDLLTRRLIVDEIVRQADERGLTLVLISHDLSQVAEIADDVVVLRDGRAVEHGPAVGTLLAPSHPYTRELLAACDAPAAERLSDASVAEPVLRAQSLTASFGRGKDKATIMDDVSFDLRPGECVALIGASGAGKTTVGRALLGLHPPDAGNISLAGEMFPASIRKRSRKQRRSIQFVPQDPGSSLNPRRTVGDTLRHALRTLRAASKPEAAGTAIDLMERVRLSPSLLSRYPRELSGGERQRVAIARALAAAPQVLICDEVTSALDVSVEASVLDLIDQLRRDTQMAVLLIAHDLRVVRRIADRVLVLDDGSICEHGVVREVFAEPRHNATRTLVAAGRPLADVLRARAQTTAVSAAASESRLEARERIEVEPPL